MCVVCVYVCDKVCVYVCEKVCMYVCDKVCVYVCERKKSPTADLRQGKDSQQTHVMAFT